MLNHVLSYHTTNQLMNNNNYFIEKIAKFICSKLVQYKLALY